MCYEETIAELEDETQSREEVEKVAHQNELLLFRLE